MRFHSSSLALATTLLSGVSQVVAQTYSSCDPLTTTGCSDNTALGSSVSIDFSSESSEFTFGNSGTITYSSDNGAAFTIAESGDAPTLTSNWYIMFGYAEFKMKIAPGTGIVSCVVMLSDDLDEIDFEWVGGDASHVQTNYFGQGADTTDSGITYDDATSQTEYKTYSVDWTSERIIWAVDGVQIRVLYAANTNLYPQTPMQIKLGIWAGGDSSNPAGTIAWAGGATDYSAGPFTMYVSSGYVQDYSTGSAYRYTDTSGDWDSIEAVGGAVYSASGSAATASAAGTTATSSSSDAPSYAGTHKESATVSYTSIAGLPSGWTVSSTGKVVPPSAASVSEHTLFFCLLPPGPFFPITNIFKT